MLGGLNSSISNTPPGLPWYNQTTIHSNAYRHSVLSNEIDIYISLDIMTYFRYITWYFVAYMYRLKAQLGSPSLSKPPCYWMQNVPAWLTEQPSSLQYSCQSGRSDGLGSFTLAILFQRCFVSFFCLPRSVILIISRQFKPMVVAVEVRRDWV